MSNSSEPVTESERELAERALTRKFKQVRLGAGTMLAGSDRSRVVRFVVADGPADLPKTVIVKRTLGMGSDADMPDRPDGPTVRFLNEWASLTILGDLADDSPLAPRLYGSDRAEGVLVMEDLRDVKSLSDSLLAGDPAAAETDLIAWATTIGCLHGQTTSRVDRFREIRDAFGWSNPGFGTGWIAPAFLATLDAVGVIPRIGLVEELATVEATFADPGDFAVLIHSDPCPGNWVKLGAASRVLDFEYSRVGHALLDGTYARVPFPTCWDAGRLPEAIIRKVETVYRAELADGCDAARDHARFERAVAEACAFWLILHCHWFPLADLLHEDGEWGQATLRQRLLARLDVVATTVAEVGHLEVLGEMAAAVSYKLHSRWDVDLPPLDLYPAFRKHAHER